MRVDLKPLLKTNNMDFVPKIDNSIIFLIILSQKIYNDII